MITCPCGGVRREGKGGFTARLVRQFGQSAERDSHLLYIVDDLIMRYDMNSL